MTVARTPNLDPRRAAFLVRRASWAIGGVALLLVAAFVELSEEIEETDAAATQLSGVDTWILRSFARVRRPWLSGIAMDLTALGSPVVVTLFTLGLAALLLVKTDRRGATMLVLSSLASVVLTVALKTTLERPRPTIVPRLVEVSGLSYPSGHSLASSAVYLTGAMVIARHLPLWSQRACALAVTAIIVLLIGVSRVYLGVHFPSDVLGGVLLGTAWALVTGGVLRRLDRVPDVLPDRS